MKRDDISVNAGWAYAWKRQARRAERKAFCLPSHASSFGTSLALLLLAAVFAISAEARQVKIKYYGGIWRGESKAAIQFLSPAKGWVGMAGWPTANSRPHQPCLLATNGGVEHLHLVTSLKLPVHYSFDSLFFLNAKLGWVMILGPAGETRLYRTVDGGKNWLELHPNLPAWSHRVRFPTPSLGFISQGEILRTTDGGKDWRKLSFPGDLCCFFDPLNGWVAGSGVVRHTRDGGKTWNVQYDAKIKHGPKAKPGFWIMQFVSATEGWIVGHGNWLLHTTDAGNTWHEVRIYNSNIGPFDNYESLHFLNPRDGVLSAEHNRAELYSKKELRHISPIDLYYYKPYLLVTLDGGRTWSYHSLPAPVGQWTQAGPSLLYGINTMNSRPEETGITEVRIIMPKAAKGTRIQGPGASRNEVNEKRSCR